MMLHDVGFSLFLSLWNQVQGQETPAIHFRMANWLEDSWRGGDRRLLLQAFRSSGKSTVTGLFVAWLLYRNADLRILVLAADLILARKMVRNVRRIIERHPLTVHLRPERADQWGSDRFTVRRGRELRDPSVLARGIDSNLTGSRADVIICDDVEVPQTCDTAAKRERLREALTEAGFTLTPGGTILYIGTPHSWYTIYADAVRGETGESVPFLNGYRRLTLPVLDAEGCSVWPERYTNEDIDQMRRAAGPNKFMSQMMLVPVNITEGRLDPGLLRFYNDTPRLSDELGGLYMQGRRLSSCSAWWDPAFGRGGDASVLAVVYGDENGSFWIQRVEYIDAPAGSDDEATVQCRRVAQIARELHIPTVTIEINGLGRLLPGILRREVTAARVACAVREVSSTRPKDIRILEAFDAVLAARILHVHEDVRRTPFIAEMQEWRPGRNNGRDDGLDAVAGALSREPLRLKPGHFAGRQGWMAGAKPLNAHTDFEV